MRACERCNGESVDVRRSKILPPDVIPTTRCGCAWLCAACRSYAIAVTSPRVVPDRKCHE